MKSALLHPILFAIFPILFLYSQNAKSLALNDTFMPIMIMFPVTIILFLIFLLIIGNQKKAAIFVSLFMILFFSFGHIAETLAKNGVFGFGLSPNKITASMWTIIMTAGFFFLFRYKRNLNRLTGFLNLFAVILVGFQLISISYTLITRPPIPKPIYENENDLKGPDTLPDIYLIVLDGYGREDILMDIYNYDNHEFLDYLRQAGFYVAEKSRSNYCQTILAMTSSLNLNYLDELGVPVDPNGDDRVTIGGWLAENRVINSLASQLGYSSVSFASGYRLLDIEGFDAHIVQHFSLNEYYQALFRSTPIPLLFEKMRSYKMHYDRIIFTAEKIPDVTEVSSPKFVYAHILAPHPPFTFDKNGSFIRPNQRFNLVDGSHFYNLGASKDNYIEGYLNNLTAINGLVKSAIEKLLAKSDRPLIIILQGDHGPGSGLDWDSLENTNLRERFSILNAYYFYDQNYGLLYPQITPINSFRVILDQYFNAEFELLDDKCYYSTWLRPYKFYDVTERLESNREPSFQRDVAHDLEKIHITTEN